MRGFGFCAPVYESGRLASVKTRSSSLTSCAWRMRSAGSVRLKRSCQRWRGAPSGVLVAMGPHRTGRDPRRPEAAGTMRVMTELLASVRRHRQALFALLMIVVVLFLLWTARGALPAFFIGLALAFVLDPGVTALASRGVPRWAGVLVSYAGLVAVIWALLYFALPPITQQARALLEE